MKTVFITGASSGIGRATALLFEKKGWNVAATVRKPASEEIFKQLKNVTCYRMDVTDHGSMTKSWNMALEKFGTIEVLVNNAGVYTTKPFETISEQETASLIQTNVTGTINMMKIALPHFREKKSGTIINLSSLAGRVTIPYQTLYHGTKWAVEGISEGLQHELRKFNIKVKIVEPGMVKTNLYDRIWNISVDDYPSEYHSSFRNWYECLLENYQKGYGPEVSARTIYKAATDNNYKLRYASGNDAKLILFLKALFPFSVFSSMVRKMSRI